MRRSHNRLELTEMVVDKGGEVNSEDPFVGQLFRLHVGKYRPGDGAGSRFHTEPCDGPIPTFFANGLLIC